MANSRPPPLGRTVRQVPLNQGPYASQGMIAPSNPFVNDDGTLTAVSFRFLYGVFAQINSLQNQVNALQTRLTNAGL